MKKKFESLTLMAIAFTAVTVTVVSCKDSDFEYQIQQQLDENSTLDEALRAQVATLEQLLQSVQSEQTTMQGVIDAMQGVIDANSKAIEEHQQAIDDAMAAIQKNTDDIVANSSLIEAQGKTIESLAQTIDEHSAAIEDNAKAIVSITEDLTTAQTAIGILENAMDEINNALTANGFENMNDMAAQVVGVINAYDDLKDQVIQNANDIITLYGDLSDVQGSVKDLQDSVSDLEDSVSDLKGDVSDLEGRVTTLEGNIIEIGDSLQSHSQAITQLLIDTKYATELAEANEARLDLLEPALQEVSDNLTTVMTDLATAQTDISNIKTDLATAQGDISAIDERLTTTEQGLQDAQDSIKSIQDDLKEVQDGLKEVQQDVADLKTQAEANLAAAEAYADAVVAALVGDDFSYETLGEFEAAVNTLFNNLSSDIEGLSDELSDLSDMYSDLADQYDDLSDMYSALADDLNELAEDFGKLSEKLDSLEERVKAVEDGLAGLTDKVDALTDRIDYLDDALGTLINYLSKQVTSILVQATVNPVFGTFSMPMSINSNVLAAFYGKVTDDDLKFPTASKKYYADLDYGPYLTSEDLQMLGVSAAALDVTSKGYIFNEKEGNAGTLYVTVNPNTVDFTGLTFGMENSVQEESKVSLEPLAPSDYKITFGYTRADGVSNGFYEAPATLKTENINENIDMGVAVEDLKNLMNDLTSYINGNSLNMTDILTSMYQDMTSVLDADAIYAEWEDTLGDKHRTYSQYSIAATAVKPLSYAFMNDVNYETFPGIGRIESIIDKLFESIEIPTFDLSKYQLEQIEHIDYNDDLISFHAKIRVSADGLTPGETIYILASNGSVIGEGTWDGVSDYVDISISLELTQSEIYDEPIDDISSVISAINKAHDGSNSVLAENE